MSPECQHPRCNTLSIMDSFDVQMGGQNKKKRCLTVWADRSRHRASSCCFTCNKLNNQIIRKLHPNMKSTINLPHITNTRNFFFVSFEEEEEINMVMRCYLCWRFIAVINSVLFINIYFQRNYNRIQSIQTIYCLNSWFYTQEFINCD